MKTGLSGDAPSMRAIGYRKIVVYLAGKISRDEAADEIVSETVAYAKRQRTWLRAEPLLTTFAGQFSQERAMTAFMAFIEAKRQD